MTVILSNDEIPELAEFVEKMLRVDDGSIFPEDGHPIGIKSGNWTYFSAPRNAQFGDLGERLVKVDDTPVWGMSYNGFVHEWAVDIRTDQERADFLKRAHRFERFYKREVDPKTGRHPQLWKPGDEFVQRTVPGTKLDWEKQVDYSPEPGLIWAYTNDCKEGSFLKFRGTEHILVRVGIERGGEAFRFERQYQGGILVPIVGNGYRVKK